MPAKIRRAFLVPACLAVTAALPSCTIFPDAVEGFDRICGFEAHLVNTTDHLLRGAQGRPLQPGVCNGRNPCTLTSAIVTANVCRFRGPQTIRFSLPAGEDTITLTVRDGPGIDPLNPSLALQHKQRVGSTHLPRILGDLTIEGHGITISRPEHGPGVPLDSFARFFHVPPTAKLTLRGLSIQNGWTQPYETDEDPISASYGGAIYNEGELSIQHTRFYKNHAVPALGESEDRAHRPLGGAIYNAAGASLTLVDSVFEANTSCRVGGDGCYSESQGEGGAIYNAAGARLEMTGGGVLDNRARQAAISNAGEMSLSDVEFLRNWPSAIGNTGESSLDEISVVGVLPEIGLMAGISNNGGSMTITRSAFHKLLLAAISNTNGGSLLLEQSTLAHNGDGTPTSGAPLAVGGDGTKAEVRSTTFYGNSGAGGTLGYGAINCYDNAEVTLRDVTVFDNEGVFSGLFVGEGCRVDAINTILWGPGGRRNCGIADTGELLTEGTNLASDATCPGFREVADSGLGPLQDNGGPTQTVMPEAGGAAENAGGRWCLDEDQRGEDRTAAKRDGACDVGAVER